MADKYPELFQPFKIGTMQVKNRLSIPPMGNNFCVGDGMISQRHHDYYGARAKGGFGLIITEMMTVDRASGLRAPQLLCMDEDKYIPGLKGLAATIHSYGTKICVQIVHPGRCTQPAFLGGKTPWAPSPIPDPIERSMPRAMTIDEIKLTVENFAQAARRVREAGCDAVEIHGAHAYLVAQFMSAYANKRTDEYGGNFENFLRFPLEIVTRTREVVGPDFPLLFRISAQEDIELGREIPDSVAMMKRLVEAGVTAVDISRGVTETIYYSCASANLPMGFNAEIAHKFKKALNVPVWVTGRINKPHVAVDILKNGQADMIHIGRQSLADPEWPNKVREGREKDIVECLSCNEACIDSLGLWHRPFVTCVQNLVVGREARYAASKTPKPKKVLVAGGGPAGMEAARTAALRGHKVTLYEKEKELGGQIPLVATPPEKGIYLQVAHARIKALKDLKVEIHTGHALTIDKVKEVKPDVLIIATGSEPLIPNIPGINRKNVVTARQALVSKIKGNKILVLGGGLVGCETADYLTGKEKKVTIIEMLDSIARDVDPAANYFLMKRLTEEEVNIMTGTTVKSIADDVIIIEKGGKEQKLEPFDDIILAIGAKSVNVLEEQAKGLVAEVYSVGDAAKPCKILDAVENAAEIALKL
jgi:2,4-dienoyl-CoA reductase-like NADH-dependent reductase (Old Yellow Enzyme family)/thioredoxin reductase